MPFVAYKDHTPLASFTKEVNPWLAKHPLKTNGCLAYRRLTSSVKEATGSLLFLNSSHQWMASWMWLEVTGPAICNSIQGELHWKAGFILQQGPSNLITKMAINSLRPRQNRCHFADNIFKCNFLNENVWIPMKISLKFVPKGPIDNIPALVQIIAWREQATSHYLNQWWPSSTTHICVTRPQWVKSLRLRLNRRPFADKIFKCIFLNED